MSNVNEKIDNLLKNDVVDRHSFFQLKYFVIGKEPTIQAKLWRCIKELKSRRESLNAINLEIEEVNDNKLLLDIQIKDLEELNEMPHQATESMKKQEEIRERQFQRKIRSYEDVLATLKNKLKDTEEEAAFFLKAYESLIQHEELKPWDDETAQLDYWNEKLSQELNMKLLLNRPLDVELIKTILSLQDDAPIKVQTIHILDKVQKDALAAKKQKQLIQE